MTQRKILLIILSALLLVLLHTSSTQPGHAQDMVPLPFDQVYALKKAIKIAATVSELPIQPDPEAANRFPDLAAPSAELTGWTKVAYQSYLGNNNYEVVVADGDGSSPVRLTFTSANDGRARLDRGTQQVVFSSNRDGDFEIFSIKIDGSGLRQLTFNTTSDARPGWSPDGSKIAFTRLTSTGYYQIFTMNADGSGVKQLTSAAGVDCLDPSWSPDGSLIAFACWEESGMSHVYTVPAGGGNRVWRGSELFAGNPVWSPKGDKVAYDYALAGSFFNDRVKIVNLDNSLTQIRIDRYQPYEDIYLGAWSPDGSQLLFNRIQYVLIGQYLYISAGYMDTHCMIGCLGPMRILGTGLDFMPDWQTADAKAPDLVMNPLAQYTRPGKLQLSWSPSDIEGPNIINYAIQVKRSPSGVWEFLTHQFDQNYVFDVKKGEYYAFRGSVTDAAYNISPWPMNAQAETRIFSSLLNGLIQDERGYPVAGVQADLLPQAWEAVAPDQYGEFLVHAFADGNHKLSLNHSGYGLLPEVNLIISADKNWRIHLPPKENMIAGGTFEAPDLSGWTITSTQGITTPLFSRQAATSGSAGLVLGAPFMNFSSLETLRSLSTKAYTPDLAVDSQGNLLFTWHIMDGADSYKAFFMRCTPSLDCSVPVDLGSGRQVKIAIGPDDRAHLTWLAEQFIVYRSENGVGSWNAQEVVGDISLSGYYGNPDIAVGTNGNVHILWIGGGTWGVDYRGILYRERAPAGWDPVSTFMEQASIPTIAMGADNSIHIAWDISRGYTQKPAGGSWLPIEHPLSSMINAYQSAIVVEPSGIVHLVSWKSYAVRSLDNTWTVTPLGFTVNFGSTNLVQLPDQSLVMSDSGNGVAVKPAGSSLFGPVYQPFSTGSGFQREAALALYPKNGELILAAIIKPTDPYAYYSTLNTVQFFTIPETTGNTQISQTVTLSQSMHAPTLAFEYQYFSGANNGDQLEVSVQSGETITMLGTIDAAGKGLVWYDLSPYAGQTLQVMLTMSNTTNSQFSWVYLDDITLGEWRTPVITEINPVRFETWVGEIITITGTNFIPTPTVSIGGTIIDTVVFIDEHTLQVVLPAALPPGPVEVWVINPGGTAGAAPQLLDLGRKIFLPLNRRGP